MREARVQNEIRLALGSEVTLFRNNVGTAWAGKHEQVWHSGVVRVEPGDVVVRQARVLHAGLCKGSSDLIGWRSVLITPDMAGSVIAVFSAVEVKGPKGRATTDQVNFTNNVIKAGGLACIAKSPEEARQGLGLTQGNTSGPK